MSKIEVKTLDPILVATISHKGDYLQIGDKFDELMYWASERDLLDENARVLGIYYDNPMEVETDKLRSKAAISISDDVEVGGKVEREVIPGGKYAIITHIGPYEDMEATYLKIYNDEWFAETGNAPDLKGACYEEYLNNPNEEDPANLKTIIYAPLL